MEAEIGYATLLHLNQNIDSRLRHRNACVLLVSLFLTLIATGDSVVPPKLRLFLPPQTLWAWERPEDLRFLPSGSGVAYLAGTITLSGNTITERPRMSRLLVPPGVHIIAVVRIESDGGPIPPDSIPQLAEMILSRAARREIEGLQIDFDARRSQRESFRALLHALRQKLPSSQSLSITALASWCQGDAWMRGLPVDYAVPMLFRLGPERDDFRNAAMAGRPLREPLCRAAYGLSTDEPLLVANRSSVFWFSPTPWNAEQFRRLGQRK